MKKINSKEIELIAENYALSHSINRSDYPLIKRAFIEGMLKEIEILNGEIRESEEVCDVLWCNKPKYKEFKGRKLCKFHYKKKQTWEQT